MSRTFAPKTRLYASLGAAAMLAALVLGSPVLAAVGAALVLYLVVALALAELPQIVVGFETTAARAVEGDRIDATVTISSDRDADVELALALPRGVRLSQGVTRQTVHVRAGSVRTLALVLVAERWGAYVLGEVAVRVSDRFGFVDRSRHQRAATPLRVYPKVERLRALIRPFETQPYFGNRIAAVTGEGIEFADIRPFVSGDRVRRVNWRATTRRQQLYVNVAHPERNSDVVLFLDTFAQAARHEQGTLDVAVRLAASLARAYLEQRDRVGVVGFGGIVRWLTPSMGRTQLYRIVDALLSSDISLSYTWKGLEALPPRSLPAHALVIGLSPLLDERAVNALVDLRARGFDLAIVDVSPLPFAAGYPGVDPLVLRLWALWRQALRYRYERLGVPVVEWTPTTSVAELVGEVTAFRRHMRRVSA